MPNGSQGRKPPISAAIGTSGNHRGHHLTGNRQHWMAHIMGVWRSRINAGVARQGNNPCTQAAPEGLSVEMDSSLLKLFDQFLKLCPLCVVQSEFVQHIAGALRVAAG